MRRFEIIFDMCFSKRESRENENNSLNEELKCNELYTAKKC